MKELESQLLVERKLARQHVDTKIAEQHQLMKQQDEENMTPTRPPLSTRHLGSLKDQQSLSRPIPGSPSDSNFPKFNNDFTEKENNPIPNTLEQQQPPLLFLPKRLGRASLCPPPKRQTLVPRRTSLIPIPSAFTVMPTQNERIEESGEAEESGCLPDNILTDNSPKMVKSNVKKLSNALRRSIQRRIKSPMQQHVRRGGGVNIGMERVRVSIGSRGKIANRAFSGTGRVVRTKEVQQMQKHNQKEKERGWHIGNVGRNVI